jgi:hypothetical protein
MRKSSKRIPDGAKKTVRDIRGATRREAFSRVHPRAATHRREESRHAKLGLGKDLGEPDAAGKTLGGFSIAGRHFNRRL